MIGFDAVSLNFGEKEILKNCSFVLPDSGLIGLSAPSGVGKTTLLRLLAGLISPQEGEIHRPQEVAILFQENRLLPWRTVRQHLSDVLPHSRHQEIESWLQLADLWEERGAYPPSLSGGMGRRLALVRTLALGGDLILLDEPFTGIDGVRSGKMMDHLKTLSVPVVIASHESAILAQCNHLFLLSDGQIDQKPPQISG